MDINELVEVWLYSSTNDSFLEWVRKQGVEIPTREGECWLLKIDLSRIDLVKRKVVSDEQGSED